MDAKRNAEECECKAPYWQYAKHRIGSIFFQSIISIVDMIPLGKSTVYPPPPFHVEKCGTK